MRVRDFWLEYVVPSGIQPDTLARLVSTLHEWAKKLRPNFRSRIECVHFALLVVHKRGNFKDQGVLLGDYHHILKEQKIYWLQRSRVLWLQEGDRNTSFFHWKASARRSSNTIRGLFNQHGIWCSSPRDILQILSDYFSSLFSDESVSFMPGLIFRFNGLTLTFMILYVGSQG